MALITSPALMNKLRSRTTTTPSRLMTKFWNSLARRQPREQWPMFQSWRWSVHVEEWKLIGKHILKGLLLPFFRHRGSHYSDKLGKKGVGFLLLWCLKCRNFGASVSEKLEQPVLKIKTGGASTPLKRLFCFKAFFLIFYSEG